MPNRSPLWANDHFSSFLTDQKPPEHAPSYLPAFPAEHTYRETSVYVQPQQDEKTKAIRAHEVKKMTEDVLIQLGGSKDKPGFTFPPPSPF